jgi:hypothetical protein
MRLQPYKISFVLLVLFATTNMLFSQGFEFLQNNKQLFFNSNSIEKLDFNNSKLTANFNATKIKGFEFFSFNYTTMPTATKYDFLAAKSIVIKNSPKSESLNAVYYYNRAEQDNSQSKSKESFFTSELLYFVGAVALASTFYIIWSDNNDSVNKKSFGQPPKPN